MQIDVESKKSKNIYFPPLAPRKPTKMENFRLKNFLFVDTTNLSKKKLIFKPRKKRSFEEI